MNVEDIDDMTLQEKLEFSMAARRAELINQPLAPIWGELAKVAEETCRQEFYGDLK